MDSKVSGREAQAAGFAVDDAIAAVVAMVEAKLPAGQAAADVAGFVRRYYALTAPEDLAERAVEDLYGAALSHWQFAGEFAGGEAKLRVFNPRRDEYGWQSPHTVVEIVNDDMPFLVDSITMEINRQGLIVHLVVHPVMGVRRDAAHRRIGLVDTGDDDAGDADGAGDSRLESLIHVEVDRRTDPAQLDALRDGLRRILADVRKAVDDWPAMKLRIADILAEVEQCPPPMPADDPAEDLAFLRWLADDNFTLLGCRDYELVSGPDGDELRAVPGSGLGVLRESGDAAPSIAFAQMPAGMRAYARLPNLLTLTKANSRATVHRPGYLDYVGVKRFDAGGNVVGERRVLGLYTSTAYNASPDAIPLLRSKVAAVRRRAGFLPHSHDAKALDTILEAYPRDELIQIGVDDLHDIAIGILRLGERQRTRLFVRRDAFGRFHACLLYVPRENYDTRLRRRMQAMLIEAFQGLSSDFTVHLSDSPLARILIVVRTRPGAAPAVDLRELEQRLARLARRWEDDLGQSLAERYGEERGKALHQRYGDGFSAGYRDEYRPQIAVEDIERLDTLAADDDLAMSLYRPPGAPAGQLRFRLYGAGTPAPLSRSLPILEHMGVQVLEERPFEIRGADGRSLWIGDFGLSTSSAGEIDVTGLRERFEQTFLRCWRGDCESDDFNRLVMLAGLDWRDVTILRAYARHMKQAAFTFSQAYIERTLAAHPSIAAALVALFRARFDPTADEGRAYPIAAGRAEREAELVARIDSALEQVSSLDEDRILRQYLALIRATLRTNFHRADENGPRAGCLSFKLDPARIPLLPEPRPMFEIFVYSPRVEGVHLRGGKVARGGLRWSDRIEDYRTEVLGLVKAQQVKNAVIVPVGSKGGFVLRRPPASGGRDALLDEAVACYKTYLRGLLDLTDNLVDGQLVPPERVVRHDDDDPYLVVAADKGTASFSDIANGVSAEYGFWLGDAFASGGSAGYDHKAMAITARGAWESAKRHFRGLGHDIQAQDFTVVGIGDMSGDVFGNGMLLSRHIRLLAAFDHRHVFVDPNPDAGTSFAERERLFGLPRSSWADYDPALISEGGGVYPRSAKSIALSPQARAALGIESESPSPAELIAAILRAPVDLLYNGGIGTYVKASTETQSDVGDRANDAIRVDGAELRCKVVVEGGNLGCTQRGRIEYALAGGLINTDAIDNSAGVDCSDHEVNIKVLLAQLVADGELKLEQRDRLLVEMTDEVARLVLLDNYAQNQVLGVARRVAAARLDEHARYMRQLAAAGRLDREIEYLPSDKTLEARREAGIGLCTPELAVLLAYNKMALYDAVLASDLPEDPYLAKALAHYFPSLLVERYPGRMRNHPLRREIVATQIVNGMVNRAGPSFSHRLQEETGAAPADIVRAWLGACAIFGLDSLWEAVEALDHQVEVEVQDTIVLAGAQLAGRGAVWLLQHRDTLRELGATIERFAPGAAALGEGLERWLAPHEREPIDEQAASLRARAVPEALARRVARLDAQFSALDIVEIAESSGQRIEAVAVVYFGLGGRLDLGRLSAQVAALEADGRWASLARVALRDDLTLLARGLAQSVLSGAEATGESGGHEGVPEARIDAWEARREFQLARYRQVLADQRRAGDHDLAMLSVTLRELRALI